MYKCHSASNLVNRGGNVEGGWRGSIGNHRYLSALRRSKLRSTYRASNSSAVARQSAAARRQTPLWRRERRRRASCVAEGASK